MRAAYSPVYQALGRQSPLNVDCLESNDKNDIQAGSEIESA